MKTVAPLTLVALVLLAGSAPAESLLGSEPPQEESSGDAAAPVGGLFGLFGKPSAAPAEPEVGAPAIDERAEPEAPAGEQPKARAVVEPSEESPAAPVAPEVAVPPMPEPSREASTPAASEPGVRPPPQDLDSDLRASRRPQSSSSVELPSQEIQGEIERPDIFFLLPKARSRSDEQLIRARIRREITRPLIKDWLEEELLLK